MSCQKSSLLGLRTLSTSRKPILLIHFHLYFCKNMNLYIFVSCLFLLSIWPKTNFSSLCILRVLFIAFHDTHPIHTERKDCISEDIKNYSSMRTLPSLVRKAARIQETQIMFHASVSYCSYCG